MGRAFGIVLMVCLAWRGGAQEVTIDASLEVRRTVIEVRAVDFSGRPLLDLKADDFLLTIDGEELAIESCHYFSAEEPPPEVVEWDLKVDEIPFEEEFFSEDFFGADETPAPRIPSQVNVLLFQGDRSGIRHFGYLRGASITKDVVDAMPDGAYTAVFSFFSHLDLISDFTNDKALLRDAIEDMVMQGDPVAFMAQTQPSLASFWDPAVGEDVAEIEQAFLEIAKLLRFFPGPKNVIYVGWGVGEYRAGTVSMRPEYEQAVTMMALSHASIFSLDITMADYHDLEHGMKAASDDTGGSYAKLYRFHQQATRRLADALSGYYLLAYREPENVRKWARYKLKLRSAKGEIMARAPYAD